MVTQKQFNALKNASNSYLSNDEFGIRDIENVMNDIFGTECTGDEAVSWACYWNELNIYEENLRNGGSGDVPKVCSTESSSTRKPTEMVIRCPVVCWKICQKLNLV